MNKERYVVSLKRPEGVSVGRMREYIRNSIATMGGCFEPPNKQNNCEGDPLFGGVANTVRIEKKVEKI